MVDLDSQPLAIDIGALDRKSFDTFLPLADEVLSALSIGWFSLCAGNHSV